MKVKMQPTSAIIKHLGIDPNGKVQKYFTKRCADYMDKFVPYDEGNLADYRIDGNKIIYQQPYAKYQYYGISKSGKPLNYSKAKHELATSYWDRAMVSANMNDIVDEIQNEFFGGKR